MPDTWTHILFGEEVLYEIDAPEVSWVRTHEILYRFSCQGPDFFFYYKFWPWEKTHGIDDIGRDIQNIIGGEFVRTAVRYAKSQQPQGFSWIQGESYPQSVDNIGDNPVEIEDYQALLVYLMGFITHYALDSVTHPYVHYKCGIYKRDDPQTVSYYGNHKVLEALIDTLYLQEKRNMRTARERADRQIDLGSHLPAAILRLYQHQLYKHFQWELPPEELNRAYRDMVKALHLFHDPHRLKAGMMKGIRLITFGKIKYLQFFYPHTVDNSVDYLNRQNKRWLHPADPAEVHFESFDQLWDQAKERARAWIVATLRYLRGDMDAAELDLHIPNLSFSSGKEPAGQGEQVMKHFEPIFGLK